jgi:hypothetical protein
LLGLKARSGPAKTVTKHSTAPPAA